MADELRSTGKHNNSKTGNAVKPKEIFSNLSYKIKLLSLDFAPKNAARSFAAEFTNFVCSKFFVSKLQLRSFFQ